METNEQLVRKIKSGEDIANNMAQLYEQTQAFIHAIAWKYRGIAELDDLEQEGYLALYDAIDGFDFDAGCLFLTYAQHWIKQRMVRFIQNNSSVRIPAHMWEILRRYQRFEQEYITAVGVAPSDSEIRRFLGLSNNEIRQVREALKMDRIGSLDSYVGDDEENTLGDLVAAADDVEGDVLDREEQRELREILWEMINKLPEKQITVIASRYFKRKTLSQVGESMGVCLQRVNVIEKEALRNLRRRGKKLRSFLTESDQLYNESLHGNGLANFNRTWTSSTERVAMKL